MNAAIDIDAARRELERASALGLAGRARRKRAGVPKVADLLTCTFDAARDAFHVVYEDLSAADVGRAELGEVGEREVVAWAIDEPRRGVEVVLADGEVTSFSAEYPKYLRDEAYRRQVDARRGPAGQDLGLRIARRVQRERERLGWSVAELARRADMAPPNVHRVEAGRHVSSMQTISRLATALGVPLERLVSAGG